MVSTTGFVTHARAWREAGEGAANEGVQCRCKTAADTTPKRRQKHVLFIAFIYIWKFIRTPS
jgi:hypothetical protein